MTKILLVISFFVGVFFLSFFWTYFEAKDSAGGSVLSDYSQPADNPDKPSQASDSPADYSGEVSDADNRNIHELLANLQKSSRESLSDWENNQNKNLLSNNVTPYIPISTLLEAVNEVAVTPSPTIAPVLAQILEEESLQDTADQLQNYSQNYQSDSSNEYDFLQPNNNTYPQSERNSANIGNLSENPIKTTYVLAVLGDSMVETLGPGLEDLQRLLKSAYPDYSIALLNYGQGATDMDSGLFRLTNTTKYMGGTYPPLLSFKPDILVVESFAYNPWSENNYDLDRQWLTVARIIDTVKTKSPTTKIILASTIAPNPFTFGDGALNWSADAKWQKAQTVKSYLANMVNFATTQGYPLADAYHPSLAANGIGDSRFINQSDHIHPSIEGKKLFSEKIIEAIRKNNLLN